LRAGGSVNAPQIEDNAVTVEALNSQSDEPTPGIALLCSAAQALGWYPFVDCSGAPTYTFW